MTLFFLVAAIAFSACSSAPTPLYHLYQQSFGLSALQITVIFAVYAFSLLASLLTVGALSDFVGRRPVILGALLVNALSMLLFIDAHSAGMLIAARAVQGLATGAAITTLGAAILDVDRVRGAIFNSITAFAGLSIGSLGAATLVTLAPYPLQLVYGLLLVATLLLVVLLARIPETALGRSGALASMVPRLHVPAQVRGTFLRVMPVNMAGWMLGGFYLSVMPSLLRVATGIQSPFVGGAVVGTLMLTALVSVLALRLRAARQVLIAATLLLAAGVPTTLLGVRLQYAWLMLLGTVIAGVGFGSAFSGVLRTVLPLVGAEQRAGLLSTYYVASYLAFSVPAILLGLIAPLLGLPRSAYLYGSLIVVMAMMSLVATLRAAAARR
jgi:hypothetical protein